MSDSSRRSNKTRISYAEVDSDADLSSDSAGGNSKFSSNKGKGKVKKTLGDTYGTTEGSTRSKKRAHKSSSKKSIEAEQQEEEEKEQPVYDPKLLLDMPFDIFAETCSHLEGADLISLAQLNKRFRRILLSQNSQTIWTRRRMSDGYPLPEDMSELQFAMFIYGKACQGCGEELYLWGNHQRNFDLRCHICHECRETLLISSLKIDTDWTDLHPQATECVRYETEEYGRRKTLQNYVIDELDDVDQTLKDLEDEDESILAQRDQVRYKSSTRSRPKQQVDLPQANKVATFVQARREWVKNEKKLSNKLTEALSVHEQAIVESEKEAVMRKRDKLVEARLYLEESCGWSEEELKRFFDQNRSYYTPSFGQDGVPQTMPQDDAEGWETYHSQIQEELSDHLKDEARRTRETTVQEDFYPLALEALEASDESTWGIPPSKHDFSQLSTVRPLWKPDDARASQDDFTAILPSIVEQMQAQQEKSRVKAIRSILASNAGVPISNFSLKSSDYPPAKYDTSFFELATSVFYHRPSIGPCSFPEIVENKHDLDSIRNGITLRQKDAVLAMIAAAELDATTTTWKDLVDLGERFKWTNQPHKSRRSRWGWGSRWECDSLLAEIMRFGPKNKEIEEGNGVKIEYVAHALLKKW